MPSIRMPSRAWSRIKNPYLDSPCLSVNIIQVQFGHAIRYSRIFGFFERPLDDRPLPQSQYGIRSSTPHRIAAL